MIAAQINAEIASSGQAGETDFTVASGFGCDNWNIDDELHIFLVVACIALSDANARKASNRDFKLKNDVRIFAVGVQPPLPVSLAATKPAAPPFSRPHRRRFAA